MSAGGHLLMGSRVSDADIRYYETRAKQEAEAAVTASNETVASAHRLLALEYEAHAKALRKNERVP